MTEIFVFGSNLAGRHGKGAALHAAKHFAAERGVGHGPTGRSYAIPTKGYALEVLPLLRIERYVSGFVHYARAHPHLRFRLTAIGCGLAGYKPAQIVPLFQKAGPWPENVIPPPEFEALL